jgi:2-polyprenyl-3-methyl-5-hydroxy-6-metoxy-1,4-benzoquinol methylase
MSVLELGSQDGGLTKHLIHATGGGHVTSIDIAPTYIARTADYLDRLHLLGPGVNLEVADVSTYDTRRRYDVIVAFEILEHVIDPRQVLRNVWRLLRRRSGTVLITVPDETVLDTEGEHIHALHPSDIIQIAGESTGIRPVVWHEHVWYFATIERGGVSYVP